MHHHLKITGVAFAAALGVARFFQDRQKGLGVDLVPLVSVLSLVFANPTYHMEGTVFDLPNRRDEPLAAEPTIG